MATAPVADQQRLLDVQDADLRLRQSRHRLETLPQIAQIAELQGRAFDLEEEAIARGTDVEDLRREVTKAEDDVQTVRTRAERDNARLTAGTGSAKDLQALQSELEVLAKRQSALEDIEIEAMERLETAEKVHADAVTQRDAITAQIAELESARAAAASEIADEIADIEAERVLKSEGLDAGLVSLYERLRDQNGGIGAARLSGSRCLGCNMTLNPGDVQAARNAPADQVVRCEECGCILVRVEEPSRKADA
ncbi:C4-type zinc ribbon domain-containing protein [Demequina sp. B12]|uniref:zinc ribbon domain-containing protein n=1 Tax=Demequina sp. B12 TaxID=2992757 RepID=UPI00237C2F14|nr:C4-type zinc ribbon domain-containing protein [Demequina sp. B12]MDE0572911.1 C4-type zinc ribbon domain-containing protein [Demequina sp. B12]